MNGWNNGAIVLSQREIAAALSTTNFRAIGKGIAELMQHGLIDVSAEGQWKERQAREYRLTFVTTKAQPATNDYLKWAPSEKSGADDVSAADHQSADGVSARPRNAADDVSARIADHRRKTAIPENVAADDVSSLIVKPYPPAETAHDQDQSAPLKDPYSSAGPRFDNETEAQAVEVRSALAAYRRANGLAGIRSLASAAGADASRVSSFIDGMDLLSAPTISRLSRELRRSA